MARNRMALRRILCLASFSLAVLLSAATLSAVKPRSMTPKEFGRLHDMIKPHAGESRWMEIDWYPSVWEARQRAAAEGKPIFLMAGSGGAPVAGC